MRKFWSFIWRSGRHFTSSLPRPLGRAPQTRGFEDQASQSSSVEAMSRGWGRHSLADEHRVQEHALLGCDAFSLFTRGCFKDFGILHLQVYWKYSFCGTLVCLSSCDLSGDSCWAAAQRPRDAQLADLRPMASVIPPLLHASLLGFSEQHLGGCTVFWIVLLLLFYLALSQHFMSIKCLRNID